jgi:hypothetical protein
MVMIARMLWGELERQSPETGFSLKLRELPYKLPA